MSRFTSLARKQGQCFILACLSVSGLLCTGYSASAQDALERLSVTAAGGQADGSSYEPSVSADGRYVAFVSEATNLVSGDTNATWDVFVKDRQTGALERVSVTAAGVQGNARSIQATLSANGRFVAFVSYASNLVAGDTNNWQDVFVKDRLTGAVERASVGSAGAQAEGDCWVPAISGDGRYVAFASGAGSLIPGDPSFVTQVYVKDRQTRVLTRASVGISGEAGNDHSDTPVLSADGRLIAFASRASNLVAGDTMAADVFARENGPGLPEWRLAWQNTRTGDVSFWRLSGTALIGTGLLFQGVPTEWRLFGSTDLNGDGSRDLLWHNARTGDVTYWLMNRTARLSDGFLSQGVPLAWRPAAAAPLRAGGPNHILWQNAQTGDVSFWQLDGTSVPATGSIWSGVPQPWELAGMADLDGNNSQDLLWRNTQNGDLTYWLMDGTTKLSNGYLFMGVPLAWRLAAMADIDADGDEDLIWHNSQTGDVSFWRMQGQTISETGFLFRGVPGEWQLRAAF